MHTIVLLPLKLIIKLWYFQNSRYSYYTNSMLHIYEHVCSCRNQHYQHLAAVVCAIYLSLPKLDETKDDSIDFILAAGKLW